MTKEERNAYDRQRYRKMKEDPEKWAAYQEKHRTWCHRNRKTIAQKNAERYKVKRQEILEYSRQYYYEHRQARLEYAQRYYQEHREEILEYAREYRNL